MDIFSEFFPERHRSDIEEVNGIVIGYKILCKHTFTETAWEAIISSVHVAREKDEMWELKSVHLMKALLEQWNGLARQIFFMVGVDSTRLAEATDKFIQRIPSKTKILPDTCFISGWLGELNLLLPRAKVFKTEYNDNLLSIEHLVLAFVEDETFGKQLYKDFQIGLKSLKDAIGAIRGIKPIIHPDAEGKDTIGGIRGTKTVIDRDPGAIIGTKTVIDRDPERKFEALQKYGKDLTMMARSGKLDSIIGRDDEIRRCIQILCRKTKSNILLIGEPGVGKTAISEGLAQRIVEGDVPHALKNRRLVSLDMGALIADAIYRGLFEDRLKAVLEEVTESDGQIILFIDEIHTVVTTGHTEGSMGAGHLLKSMLARGELRCIGATTLDEYKKYFEKDPALERRFHQVYVEQTSGEDTLSILRGLREGFELHHGVRISDNALVAAVALSDRYISNRFLPDKAIDLVDEAAAKLIMEMASKPTALDGINRTVLKLDMEKLSLTKDVDKESEGRSQRVEGELSLLKTPQSGFNEQWEHEKMVWTRLQSIREEIDKVRLEIHQAERDYNLIRAAD